MKAFSAGDDPDLQRNLRASVGDGTAYGVMVGVGETYLPAFVLAVGLGDVFAGLIASVPILVGSLLQMVSPAGVLWLKSHRRWVVLCAGIQACCFIPLIIAALLNTISPTVALLVASIYWGTSLGTGPAWNTWQGTIIPRAIRPGFFAARSRLAQLATLSGFLIGGFSLQLGKSWENPVPFFAFLFTVAAVSRAISTWCLASQTEPMPLPPNMRWLTLSQQLHRFTRGTTGRLLTYIVAMQCGVFISGPYFAPYMLKTLNLSYIDFAVLLGICFVAKFAMLPVWGRFAHRYGARQLLWVGGATIVPLALAWTVSNNFWWLFTVQVASGVFWAAYELALVLLFFEAIPEEERTSILTLYNAVNSAALVVGSLIGAAILYSLEVSATAYLTVFAVSSGVRLCTLPLLARIPSDFVEGQDVNLRPMNVTAGSGSFDGPLLSEIDGADPYLAAHPPAPHTSPDTANFDTPESTDSESTDSESTDSESTGSESTGSESTGSESTGSESTGSESTDRSVAKQLPAAGPQPVSILVPERVTARSA